MKVLVNGAELELEANPGIKVLEDGDRLIVKTPEGSFSALSVRKGDSTFVSFKGQVYEVKKAVSARSGAAGAGSGDAVAPMPGQIVEVTAKIDQKVEKGDKLAVLEAMKMQLPVVAGIAGTVTAVNVSMGDQVADGQVLVVVKPQESE